MQLFNYVIPHLLQMPHTVAVLLYLPAAGLVSDLSADAVVGSVGHIAG